MLNRIEVNKEMTRIWEEVFVLF